MGCRSETGGFGFPDEGFKIFWSSESEREKENQTERETEREEGRN